MWMNGSRSARSTPAKARRTGKPSPSKPLGAVVTDFTGRSTASAAVTVILGRVRVSAVTAGIWVLSIIACVCKCSQRNFGRDCSRRSPRVERTGLVGHAAGDEGADREVEHPADDGQRG